MVVTDLGVGQMKVNVFMKDKVRKIMQSSVKMTPSVAHRGSVAEGEEDNQAPRGCRALKDCAQGILCVGKVYGEFHSKMTQCILVEYVGRS